MGGGSCPHLTPPADAHAQEFQSLLCVTPEVVEDLVRPGGVTIHERIGGDEVLVLLHESIRSLHHRLKYLFPDSRI